MITVKTENYNLISQDFYNKTIDSLDLNLISCTCGHSGCLIRHGSYKRSIQPADRILSLSVVRVYCKICGHTHALLLSSMVPYSQIPLALHVRLIQAYEHETGFRNILEEQYLVDENNLKSIIRNYRLHWKQRLLSMRLHLPDIPSLISGCFSLFSRQFMQMKSMKQEKQQEIALMRYGAIAPIIAGLDERYPSKTAFYTEISAKGLMGPDGKLHHYAPATIEKWYLDYQNHGFEGLVPKGRSDAGMSRKLDEELQERIRYFKTNYPRMSAAAIYRQLKSDVSVINGQVSESTVSRFVKRLQSELRQTTNKDMRRYERPHINEVWCGDSSVGPRLTDSDGKKHRVYIIALIDDASRFITGIDVFYHDNFINLMSVMKSAIAKYGRPKVFNFDNGKSYKNKQMELLAARIGTTLSYCQPYTPTGKAKIERWFRTMKDQWMAALDMRDFHSLEELRGSLYTFVQQYNQSPHSSLRGLSPQNRFFSEPEQIRRLSEEDIRQDFLLEIERRVSADSVIVIDQIEYEVDYRFARQRIRLRYSPDM